MPVPIRSRLGCAAKLVVFLNISLGTKKPEASAAIRSELPAATRAKIAEGPRSARCYAGCGFAIAKLWRECGEFREYDGTAQAPGDAGGGRGSWIERDGRGS